MKCGLCGNRRIVYNRSSGEYICTNCGNVVLIDNISLEPEWRQFENDEVDKSRVGLPSTALVGDRGLSTAMLIDMDSMSMRRAKDYTRMRKFDIKAASQVRGLTVAMETLLKLGEIFDTPRNILETSAELYRKVFGMGFVKGRSILITVAAILYIAYKLHGKPKPRNEIAAAVKMMSKGGEVRRRIHSELTSASHKIIRSLRIKIPRQDPMFHLRRIAAKINLKPEVLKTAEEIMESLKRDRVTLGKNPVGMAATTIYIAMLKHGINVMQDDIAAAANITPVTIRNLYNLIIKKLGMDDRRKRKARKSR